MTARHRATDAAIELIKRFEGYRREAVRLSDGRWTIGHGHTQSARAGARVSEADAEALLLYDVRPVAAALNELIYTPLTQNQFDALVAFAFNIGVESFRRSAVLRLINAGSLTEAAGAMEMWRKADIQGESIVIDALIRRRAAEKALFLTPTDGWIPAPSAVLRPRVDYDVGPPLSRNATELEGLLRGAEAETSFAEEAQASRAAAEAVSARLSAILPELDEAEGVGDLMTPATEYPQGYVAESVHSVSVSAPSAPAASEPPLTFDETLAAEPETPGPPQPAQPTEKAWPDDANSEPFLFPSRQVVWREAPASGRTSRKAASGARMSLVMLGLLSVLGVAMFAGAALANLNGVTLGPETSGLGAAPITWGLGALGAACLAVAVYAGLRRLGGRDD